jgi:hypothetical protein
MRRSDYERQPAPEFLFERRPLRRWPPVARQPGESILVVGNQPAQRATRHEERAIPRGDAPILTVTSDLNNSITVVAGNGPDWKLFFWAEGGDQTEAQADQRLQNCLFKVTGATVSLSRPDGFGGLDARSELLVEAPHDPGVVIHGSYAAVEVRDLAGPVRIAATHARATVLNIVLGGWNLPSNTDSRTVKAPPSRSSADQRSASSSPILSPVAAMRLTIVRCGSLSCLSSLARLSPAIIAGFSFSPFCGNFTPRAGICFRNINALTMETRRTLRRQLVFVCSSHPRRPRKLAPLVLPFDK